VGGLALRARVRWPPPYRALAGWIQFRVGSPRGRAAPRSRAVSNRTRTSPQPAALRARDG